MTSERINTAGAAAQRAWLALAALETARRSEDVDRARHGAQHELETVLRVLGFPLPTLPGEGALRARRAAIVSLDEPLPFPEEDQAPDCPNCPNGRRFGCTC